jgi:hypothetical protein
MNLNKQLQILVDNASKNGVSPLIMEIAIVPILQAFASKLQHLEYYILQSSHGEWVVTTLNHRQQTQTEMRVIYAFATAEDAAISQLKSDRQDNIASLPVTHLLFQLFALDEIDGIIFLEIPGNLEKGTNISRAQLYNSIQQQLQQLQNIAPPAGKSKNIPSNWA